MSQTENYGFNIPEENEFYDMELEMKIGES